MKDQLKMISEALNETIDLIYNEKKLLSRIKAAEKVLNESNIKLNDYEIQLIKEEKDVEKLKKFTLTNMIHTLLRDKDEVNEKELSEVMQVKSMIDNLMFDIDDSKDHILSLKSKLKGLDDLEKKYVLMLKEKAALIEILYPMKWEKIMVINDEIQENNRLTKEIKEAVEAGTGARYKGNDIKVSLNKAKSWGTYDMLGGGLIATMAKRSHIDEAQVKLASFRGALRVFNKELEDVGKNIKADLDMSEFLKFADWFFDGFFVDWAVQSKITNALENINHMIYRIDSLLIDLKRNEETLIKRNLQLNMDIENYIKDII